MWARRRVDGMRRGALGAACHALARAVGGGRLWWVVHTLQPLLVAMGALSLVGWLVEGWSALDATYFALISLITVPAIAPSLAFAGPLAEPSPASAELR